MEQINQHIILARLDTQKYVSVCARGIIHLTWGMTTFRFRPHDFAHLAQILSEKADNSGHPSNNNPICSFSDEEGKLTLRILDYGLYLSPTNFLLLVDMVVTAVEKISRLPEERLRPFARPALSSQTDNRVFFSKN